MKGFPRESGNIFFALFGAVGLVGILGASTMTIYKGPVTSMHNVTQRTVAENAMIASGRLSLVAAAQQSAGGDCDADGFLEPVEWETDGVGTAPSGGGFMPASLGAAQLDPWGNTYGYCVWDHGAQINAAGCGGAAQKRLAGADTEEQATIAILSSGKDRVFQTSCDDAPDYIIRSPGSDDIVMSYTYGEASAMGGGLWNLQSGDPETAEINKNLQVKNDGGDVVFGVDGSSDPAKPAIKVDYVQALGGAAVEFLSKLIATDVDVGGDMAVTGSTTLKGTAIDGALGVSGAAALGSASVVGALDVDGATTLEGLEAGATSVGTLTAAGLASLHSLSVTNAATIGGTLNVSGAGTFNNNLLVSGTYQSNSTDNSLFRFGGETTDDGSPSADGLIIRYENDLFNTALDGLVIEKTDFNATLPDGGILFANRGSDGVRVPTLSIRGTGNVGIGTLWASAPLDVAGSAEINGQLDMTGHDIINVAAPINANDAVNKGYVDAQVAAGTGFEEQDPTIGDLNAGKWCNSDGNVIDCTDDLPLPPGDGDTIAGLSCNPGEVVKWDGSSWVCAPDDGGSPGGSNGQVQYNSSGAFAGHSGFTYDPANGLYVIGTSGRGVYGYANAATGATSGVQGRSNSTSGRGVYGYASATSGTTYGVYGATASTSGRGVLGHASATSGVTIGVYGSTVSADGYGVYSNGRMATNSTMTATAYYQSSDRNLKTDIETIADPFALLDGIAGKHFLWKDSGKGAYGVIAQDVESVMPEAIGENDEGYKTVEYGQLIAPLVEAVKQLKGEVEALRADNDNLREEVRALKAGAR